MYREWPKPVLLKTMDEDVLNLGLPVWDPKVCYNNHTGSIHPVVLSMLHAPGEPI